MQIHPVSTGAVVTLDEPEQFVFISPGSQNPSHDATRVTTVTVFAPTPNEPGYFTVAGEQINADDYGVPSSEAFWEVPGRFTDSGPLPPHVRSQVEGLVPPVDHDGGREQATVSRRMGFELAPPEVQDNVVEQIQVDELGAQAVRDEQRHQGNPDGLSTGPRGRPAGPLADVGSPKSWGERLAERARRALPGEPGSSADLSAWRRLDQAQAFGPGNPQDKMLPPSAFLNTAQVREGR
jgi:hypothetical protein